jgi:DNA-binding IclR family transcriptional regulator
MTTPADKSNTKESEGVAVIDRACAILFAFRPDDAALTLAELAARTGLYKSTLLRLAGSLIQHRLLLRLDDGRYQLGSATFMLGALYQRSLNVGDILMPLMRELAETSGESVSFYVRDEAVRVCLHRVGRKATAARTGLAPHARQAVRRFHQTDMRSSIASSVSNDSGLRA